MPGTPEHLSAALADRYRIERELGAGGMATVYLAADLKHDRKVAIKVLKPELAAVLGADRFVVEIKTTAAMSHPHILPLFDSGTADGFLFYVMPYIQGETIREKLNRETQFGIDEAIRIAREVADALDYAHRHGVIHRDIKPENILLHDGRAMVMDFGIALAVSAAAGGRMTETGLSLGTPHYMSPEQATADKDLTGRSDIYSLASVLYEMLAGSPPHVGSSAQQIIMKIIAEPVQPVTALRKSVPPHVAAAVARALEKVPADRFETARGFADALANPGYTGAIITGAAATARAPARVVTVPFLGVLALALLAFAGWAMSALRRPAAAVKHTRFTIEVPDSARIRPEISSQNTTISPDGSAIVYPGGAATPQLYLRNLNDLATTPIPGTQNATVARFSPDGKWLAFLQGGSIRKIPMPGGPAVTVVDSGGNFSWGDGDVIVYARGGALWRISAAGGTPTLVARDSANGRKSYQWPFFLPSGKALLFDVTTDGIQANAELAALRLDDGAMIPLGIIGRNPRYTASGHIVFGRLNGDVVVAAFDAARLRVTGPAVTMLDNVFIKSGGASEFGISRDGTLFYVPGTSYGEILLADHSGGTRPLLTELRAYSGPRVSPTSNRFAFTMTDRASFSRKDVWVYNDLTRTVSRLTNDGNSSSPSWMADGERVIWLYTDSVGTKVKRQRWDGSGTPEVLFAAERNTTDVVPAPDGKGFAVVKNGAFSDLYMADGDPPGALRPLVVTPAGEGGPRVSPDGRWVAYYGDESGQREVYVIATKGDGGRHQISTEGGAEPVWGPDGKTLYYRAGGTLMAAGISTSPAFAVTRRDALFSDRFRRSGFGANYDVSRDGKNFLMLGIGSGNQGAQQIVVVTGWLDELKARMTQAAAK